MVLFHLTFFAASFNGNSVVVQYYVVNILLHLPYFFVFFTVMFFVYRTRQYDEENNLSEVADERNGIQFYIKVRRHWP